MEGLGHRLMKENMKEKRGGTSCAHCPALLAGAIPAPPLLISNQLARMHSAEERERLSSQHKSSGNGNRRALKEEQSVDTKRILSSPTPCAAAAAAHASTFDTLDDAMSIARLNWQIGKHIKGRGYRPVMIESCAEINFDLRLQFGSKDVCCGMSGRTLAIIISDMTSIDVFFYQQEENEEEEEEGGGGGVVC
ncbi:hypothetical protein DAPPUDRAFT_233612 [Daphnia pulex]|uniref:Uncharacterized protein n=1 Tax=Daphnia pulex TaxID=6669 RepID=E9FV95_DAPPU|nr:hypothetical protein DAPPUDRAFT_233612 [Daphnia pulex]|eukprot:EFX88519.1 hypothetical protein DAPPUDRAFT_233612 [Daphnia pulex]